MREQIDAWAERREVTTLSWILESVQRRTITLKEEGESYEGLHGLSRTIPSTFLREGEIPALVGGPGGKEEGMA